MKQATHNKTKSNDNQLKINFVEDLTVKISSPEVVSDKTPGQLVNLNSYAKDRLAIKIMREGKSF